MVRPIVLALLLAGSALAQESDMVRQPPVGVQLIRVGQPAQVGPSVQGQMLKAATGAPFTLANRSGQSLVSLAIAPEGGTPSGNLLGENAVAPGARTELRGPAGRCRVRMVARFADGTSRTLVQDICQQPEVAVLPLAPVAPPEITMGPPPVSLPSPDLPAMSGPPPGDSGPEMSEEVAESAPEDAPSPAPEPPPSGRETPTRPGPAEGTGPGAASGAGAGTGAEARVWCAVVEEQLPAAECAFLASVERGTGAFKAPERMRRDEMTSVTLAISRTPGSDAPSQALAGAPGAERRFTPAVGRFIKAELLSGPGIEVMPDPRTPELQDLFASEEGFWRWTVTAKERGRHDLTIRTRVMTRLADGSFAPRGQPFTDSRTVEVVVAGAAAIEEGARAADRAVTAMTDTTGTLTKLLTGLGALVAAAGALWLALRNFSRRKETPGDG